MRGNGRLFALGAGAWVCLVLAAPAGAADWPMWRHDARRSAASPESLPAELYLQWVRELPKLEPAWPDEPRMRFDVAYEPVVAGKTLFVGSPRSDWLAALDVDTGAEKWRFYADGPVRFAPLAWRDKVCFASDDGHLYCLDAATGELAWRFRGGPSDRKVLGNGRLISTWPVRGAPVLADDTLYFAASIWPFMGVFLYALNPETGDVVWRNDACGALYIAQPHNSPAFAGVAPQGYLAATEDRLLVPNGRSVPACFDRATGEFLYYHLADNGKRGSYHVSAARDYFLNSGILFDLATGRNLASVGPAPVATDEAIYFFKKGRLHACRVWRPEAPSEGDPQAAKSGKWRVDKLWSIRTRGGAHIQAGDRHYAGSRCWLQAIDLPAEDDEPAIAWQMQLAGTPASMLAADGKLFVSTLQGHLFCFGARPTLARMPEIADVLLVPSGSTWKYLDDGSDQGTPWRATDFDDAAWRAGPAELGYGDKDEETLISYGSDKKKKHTTTYFRHAFEVDPRMRFEKLDLGVLVDDGAVVYLNGQEVVRPGMGKGEVGYRTKAAVSVSEAEYVWTEVKPGALVPGRNVLAVEVHQVSADSSDISFDLELVGARELPEPKRPAAELPRDAWTAEARDVLERTGVTEGYCVVLGVGTGRLAEELARQSELHVVAVDPDEATVDAVRRRLDRAGLYGRRVAVHADDPLKFPFPPYLASLVVSEDPEAGGIEAGRKFVEAVFPVLRPYGGVACLRVGPDGERVLAAAVARAKLANAELRTERGLALLRRVGPLPGSADWTHQYADAANTVVSRDTLVKAPLGLLWFGGSTNEGILPRHGHGPSEHVVGGRLFIEGPDGLRAQDVYTGRVLWRRELPGLGAAYDNTSHQPGANAIGSNFASAEDGLYVAHGPRLLRLDPAGGETLSEFRLPSLPALGTPQVTYLGLWEDILVVGGLPLRFDEDLDFAPEQFGELDEEDVAALVRWVRGVRDFQLDETDLKQQKKEPSTRDRVKFLVRNLNRMLAEPRLLDKLPGHGHARLGVAAIQESIDRVLRLGEAPFGDPRSLRQLNRRLLEAWKPQLPRGRPSFGSPDVWSGTSSKWLVAVDRYSGEPLWARFAAYGFHHNAIAIGGGKVFCVDRLPEGILRALKRRGTGPAAGARLMALDARTGLVRWQTDRGVHGTWLGYSAEHDVLLLAARPSRDMLPEPATRMTAYRGESGGVLWDVQRGYGGPCLLHGETIVTQSAAFDLLTGKERKRKHPLTGAEIPWRFSRNYGCSTVVGSEHLLTFRSAAAGFYDLASDGGTANLGGFRSGCSSNLIAANGVLNAPDYTRTCTCSYHNQTSLALVHDPEVELWTFNKLKLGQEPIRRLGLNFGAPGDRMADDGTLWLEHPFVGGPSPEIKVQTSPAEPERFRHHASWVKGKGLKWVAASGFRGIRSLTVRLRKPVDEETLPYTVRLYFVEPDELEPGERVFDIAIQGEGAESGLDIAKAAGGARRPIVRTFKGIQVRDHLTIAFEPTGAREAILCGLDATAQGW